MKVLKNNCRAREEQLRVVDVSVSALLLLVVSRLATCVTVSFLLHLPTLACARLYCSFLSFFPHSILLLNILKTHLEHAW